MEHAQKKKKTHKDTNPSSQRDQFAMDRSTKGLHISNPGALSSEQELASLESSAGLADSGEKRISSEISTTLIISFKKNMVLELKYMKCRLNIGEYQ